MISTGPELWEELERLGLNEVRIRLAEGRYGERKRPLVEEWIHQMAQERTLVLPEDPERSALYDELRELDRDDFSERIRSVADDGLLAYLRYDFGWDPDPRRSTWRAIEINRTLTARKEKRLLRPTWIGVAVAIALGIASLVVSILALRT